MSELGERLRAAREAKGLTLAQAEQATRIRRTFLEALEEEHFDALPGVVYAKGFIRNYAQFLGLDPQECLAAYHASTGAATTSLPHVLDEPLLQPQRHPGQHTAIGVLIALLVILLAAGGWYAYNRLWLEQDPWPIPQFKELLSTRIVVPTKIIQSATTLPTPDPSAALATASPTGEPAATPTATQTRAVTPSATATRTRTAIPTATQMAATPTPTPTAYEGFVVELRVIELTYVRAVVDGQMVLEKNLNPNENQTWNPQESFSMRVGNAGGVEVLVNGIQVPALGEKDEIADVTYTLDNLPQAGPAE